MDGDILEWRGGGDNIIITSMQIFFFNLEKRKKRKASNFARILMQTELLLYQGMQRNVTQRTQWFTIKCGLFCKCSAAYG